MPKRPPMTPRRAWVIVDPFGDAYTQTARNTRSACITSWMSEDDRSWRSYRRDGWTCRLVRIEEVKR